MQVSTSNDVKIYNLTAGKSIPDWFSDRKRRQLEKSDISVRRRIELLQDFDMPEVSTSVQLTLDGQYVMAAGAYKPRIRCYDTAEMSMKFERCMDSEIVKFKILSEDYSKLILLQNDRHVEFHAQYGKYHRLRIPRFGRDLAYQAEFCHLYVVGAARDVFRVDLEQGTFLSPMTSAMDIEINTCDVNPVHQLCACGTTTGVVETWDPRCGKSVGNLNCNLPDIVDDLSDSPFAITKVKFKDSLNLAVGTNSGHILLYDIRSPRPYYIKDHNYGLQIKAIEFLPEEDLIASIDTKILKIWERKTGKAVTSVEPGTDLNDMCIVPNSGLLFLANEAPKILSYFIPLLGPAPKWCGFLDSLTEELEETSETAIYDDYKFITADELETLGLGDLIGTSLLRAYMHGFFVDIRLYKKAKSIVEPFNYQTYRQQKITETLVAERSQSRIRTEKLPKVNKALAKKYMDGELDEKSKRKAKLVESNPLKDDRFGALFKNPDFEIDPTSEEYRLINPLVSKIDKRRQANADILEDAEDQQEDPDLRPEFDESAAKRNYRGSSESSDDDREWLTERRKQHKLIREEQQQKPRNRPKLPVISRPAKVQEVQIVNEDQEKSMKTQTKSLEKRLKEEEANRDGNEEITLSGGNRQVTFSTGYGKSRERMREVSEKHFLERKKLHRSGRPIEAKLKKPWTGKKK